MYPDAGFQERLMKKLLIGLLLGTLCCGAMAGSSVNENTVPKKYRSNARWKLFDIVRNPDKSVGYAYVERKNSENDPHMAWFKYILINEGDDTYHWDVLKEADCKNQRIRGGVTREYDDQGKPEKEEIFVEDWFDVSTRKDTYRREFNWICGKR